MKKRTNRILSALLVLVMVFTILPTMAFAAEGNRMVRVSYVTESGIKVGSEPVTIAKDDTEIPVSALNRIPEGYQLLSDTPIYVKADQKNVEVLVREANEQAPVKMLVVFETADGMIVGNDAVYVDPAEKKIKTAELQLPEKYELDATVAAELEVDLTQEQITVLVKAKEGAQPPKTEIWVQWTLDDTVLATAGMLTVKEGTAFLVKNDFAELLYTMPEGYKLKDESETVQYTVNGNQVLVPVEKVPAPVEPTYKTIWITWYDGSTYVGSAGTVNVPYADEFVDDSVIRGLAYTIPSGYELVSPYEDYYISGNEIKVAVQKIHYWPDYPDHDHKEESTHMAYIVGYTDGKFHPEGQITRAEAATIFFRLMSDSSRSRYWKTSNPFRDVADNAWYNTAVSTLYNAGVITDSTTNFRPNEAITRAELAVMAANFTDQSVNRVSSFNDVPRNYWAADEIALAEYMGWIEGYPDGSFRPNNSISRAEAVAIINRMTGRAVRYRDILYYAVSFSDVPVSAWYYEDVQEAANTHDFVRTNDLVPGRNVYFESWVRLRDNPNWPEIEKTWSQWYR